MKRSILEKIKTERLLFDGGMGTLLVKHGLRPSEPPEVMNGRDPEAVKRLHSEYIAAGADIIKTNTFGINSLKYDDCESMLATAVGIANDAVSESGREVYVAFDVGPTGRMLKPLGDLDFEDAVSVFKNNMKHAEALGCDLILIETMGDIYETKAAILAAKESSELPVFVTCAFGSDGKLMTGGTPAALIAMAEGMGVDAVGINCSTGPSLMKDTLEEFLKYSSVPVVVNPNAGLPCVRGDETVYDVGADEFAEQLSEFARMGATILGGCCGTTPDYIRTLRLAVEEIEYSLPTFKDITLVSSYTHAVKIGGEPIIVGERINPTGKPKLKAALREKNMSYILSEAIAEEEEGAHILDVNTGLADIDESEMMLRSVKEIQAVTDLPLQIDSGNAEALARAMRAYSGKPMVNSITGAKASMDAVLPLVKKYGGVVIALTMDEEGIPADAEGRVKIAERIAAEFVKYGLHTRDLVIDPLAMTVASGGEGALVTLDAVKQLVARGFKTSLGVSNISFGLPERDVVNSAFFSAALWAGLNMAIVNPHSPHMMNAYYAYLALSGRDDGCVGYVERVRRLGEAVLTQTASTSAYANTVTLGYAIEKGLVDAAGAECVKLLSELTPTDIINREIIPALNRVGDGFEKKKIFLPSLLKSAEAASAAFAEIKERAKTPEADNGRTVVLATVKGDIHDIGKNIVKLMLESFGYNVIDLGKDVSPDKVVEALDNNMVDVLGLSALMTTTLPAMAETVRLVKEKHPEVKIMLGGAVLTETYASGLGAGYSPDAISAVRLADKFCE